MKKPRNCFCCNKEYFYCGHGCKGDNPEETWRFLFCSENCKIAYEAWQLYKGGSMNFDEFAKTIESMDFKDILESGTNIAKDFKETLKKYSNANKDVALETAAANKANSNAADKESTKDPAVANNKEATSKATSVAKRSIKKEPAAQKE